MITIDYIGRGGHKKPKNYYVILEQPLNASTTTTISERSLPPLIFIL